MTWRDVWKKKPVEYLRIVAENGEPVWDAESKQFIAKVDGVDSSAYSKPSQPSAPMAGIVPDSSDDETGGAETNYMAGQNLPMFARNPNIQDIFAKQLLPSHQ